MTLTLDLVGCHKVLEDNPILNYDHSSFKSILEKMTLKDMQFIQYSRTRDIPFNIFCASCT